MPVAMRTLLIASLFLAGCAAQQEAYLFSDRSAPYWATVEFASINDDWANGNISAAKREYLFGELWKLQQGKITRAQYQHERE
jgi:hypothetical protein